MPSRAQRVDVKAKLIVDEKTGTIVPTAAYKLGAGSIVLVEAGDAGPFRPGEIIEGVASRSTRRPSRAGRRR